MTSKVDTMKKNPNLVKNKRKEEEEEGEGEEEVVEHKYFDGNKGKNSIERIVHRLRKLGVGSDDDEVEEEEVLEGNEDGVDNVGFNGEEKLGDLLQRNWGRPDTIIDDEEVDESMLLPWERGESRVVGEEGEKFKDKRVRAPTLAELTIEDVELRRLRTQGMTLRERINIPKAGVTTVIVEKIHEKWRKAELVRLKFHETLAHDMRTAHEIVERRTGGLVIWRSGSVMVDDPQNGNDSTSVSEKIEQSIRDPIPVESLTEEEIEYNSLLDGLGPRFVDWWGTGWLPIDADLLPPTIPGYKTPFRLLATGMRSRLTNAEMTNIRKLAKSLPSHFALGRNRNHQGLASAIVKLWEKSLVAKIAVKRGIQNTNNKIMAEELKMLTGGTLLLRNKYYIVIYRGKDFLPTSVAVALAERQELTKEIQGVEEKVRGGAAETASVEGIEEIQDVEEKMRGGAAETASVEGIEEIQDVEEKMRGGAAETASVEGIEGKPLAGTLAEFHEAQARWGKEVAAEELEKMKEEATRAKKARVVKRIEHKLGVAQAKMLRAEKLLAKIEVSMIPVGPSDDQETITDEERFMFRRVGLKMKAYLPIGIRGVFSGVIENMHLHWKHRELVKLMSKQKILSYVEDSARLLEYESGGILVAIERVPKGYALIYYRGKNYQRPISLRPRNLLTKAKALKRSVAMQRHEALCQHISELERNIEQMKSEISADLGDSKDSEDKSTWSSKDESRFELTQSEDEDSSMEPDDDEDDLVDDEDYGDSDDEDLDWEDDEEPDS
ncbi:hypothetical protein IFM89_024350 [Coptis chinensis]|uniref:CRM domain-containing protein n=1 Tax=Coptis chinensis TaxID=261450 RepID=A0A835J0B7_9MAGN|nr:hypothetical protein IFM89_024350 [Coptis chinensis]